MSRVHEPGRGRSRPRRMIRRPEMTIVVAVGDVEEVVGHRVRAVAAHLRSLGLRFEILAVDAGSTDNSFGVLALLARQVPEMRALPHAAVGHAFLRGTAEARGEIVVLLDASVPAPLAPLGWAVGRLASSRQAVILRGRYIVARRAAALPVIARACERFRSLERRFERRFERAAVELGVDVVGTRPRRGPGSRAARSLLGPVLRLLEGG